MKTRPLLIVTLVFLGLSAVNGSFGGETSLGGALFDENSDQGTNQCYEPLRVGAVHSYEGFGQNVGNNRSEAYTAGGLVAGVKTVKRHVVETTGAGTQVEDWWLAFDTQDNVRVLKLTRGGALLFEATSSQAPPVYMPANPVFNDRWTLFGETMVVVYPHRPENTALLRLAVTSGLTTYAVSYSCGVGKTVTDFGGASGWNLKAQ